jgi:flagellar secretion chaperone FliS
MASKGDCIMVFPNQGYQAYQKNKYETASPHRLILFLYEGAIRFGNQAIKDLQDNNVKAAHTYIMKTQDIIYELIACLDLNQGGEIAANLYNLYRYIIDRLIHANLRKDIEAIEEVIKIITDIKTSWEEIGKDVALGRQPG